MEVLEKNVKKAVDNTAYKEKFQFQVWVNDNIICQRYFKIAKFNNDSLVSEELFDALDNCVRLLKNDLESKSRVYLWYTQEQTTQLTGFNQVDYGALYESMIGNHDKTKNTMLVFDNTTGRTVNLGATYAKYTPKPWDEETEFVKPWESVFKFKFLVDENVVYEQMWDGSQYPKYVRNCVDITNAKSQYPLVHVMNAGKKDLVFEIIGLIHNVCSNTEGQNGEIIEKSFTKKVVYGVDTHTAQISNVDKQMKKNYSYNPYNKEYINGWRKYLTEKNKQ